MINQSQISPGQRWISESEPELGLGILLKVEFKRVEVMFPAANETRVYALDTAPIRRVSLRAGETLETHTGEVLAVDEVLEKDGLLVYRCGERALAEAELSDTMSFSKPEDRLLGGHVDELYLYDLRVEALQRQCEVTSSPARGFLGGRVDLIPHQMYIAGEVASRLAPRVLLADEVGLGKTIEACLVMHRLHLTGRADRVLILLPEPLLHQWFVELLRRFNLLFSLFDEARCEALETGGEGMDNPFLDSQLVICSVDFLADSPLRAEQAVAAGWDLLIVDEAHHLEWSAEEPSEAYQVVDALAQKTEGLLLLTATPRQLGAEGHFARLRLLDPEKYINIESFQREAENYEELADAVGRLLEGRALSQADRALFTAQSDSLQSYCDALDAGDESVREPLMRALLDSFGTGRVMFRNTRQALSGFPERKVSLVEVEDDSEKLQWLVGLLKKLGEEKVLLICQSRELAEEISERLQAIININCAHFHEGMTLLQRDRSAAYFSEEEGARILICSEIGSEGRNFQFAHHLVLYDLPENPELLEQRIGRLDRIGQTETIKIHVPYVTGERGEMLARWYHEGLDAFEQSLNGATEILREIGQIAAGEMLEKDLLSLIAKSKRCREQVSEKLERGYDRLLELNSSRPESAAELIREIDRADGDQSSEAFLVKLWDHFGLHVEELTSRSYLLLPGHLLTNDFPALPDDGLNITFDRTRALSREDTTFMSWDHPMARVAMELLLTAEGGNSSFGVWEGAPIKGILLEAYYVVECIAPSCLHSDRFLPITPIRIQVDHAGNDMSEKFHLKAEKLRVGALHSLLGQEKFRREILPNMLDVASQLVLAQKAEVVANALKKSNEMLSREIERLVALGEINDHVSEDEIAGLRAQKEELHAAISKSRVRLDSVRVIWCQP
ncbi:MAG: helicase-related protein [Akkermansiaceae bacterium]